MCETLEGILRQRGEDDETAMRFARRLAPAPLFKVQRRALADSGLLDGASMLLISPTGTGKSLVADALAMRAVLRRQVVVYMVSTRALARERFRQLQSLLGPEGIRVVLSTRDERTGDEDITSGRTDLVVTVYEKARALFLRSSGFRASVDVLIADEFQMLLDPDRGLGAETLLGLWKNRENPPQILALSAGAPQIEEPAARLGLEILRSEERVVPLRTGELDLENGVATWKCAETGEQGRFGLFDPQTATDTTDALLLALEKLPAPVLVFTGTRREAWRLASLAAERRGLRDSGCQLDQVDALQELLSRGVAVHSAELTRTQRQRVEKDLNSGAIDLAFATTTLSDGVNIGVRTVVVLSGVAEKTGVPKENLYGRAGRPGVGEGFAFSLRSTARATVVQVPPVASLQSRMEAVATVMAAEDHVQRDILERLFAEESGIEGLLEKGAREGFWSEANGKWSLTAGGQLLAAGGIDSEAVCGWRTMLRRFRETGGTACHAFLALGGGNGASAIPISHDDRLSARWLHLLCEELHRDKAPVADYFLGFLDDGERVARRLHQAAKGVLIYLAALDGTPLFDLASQFEVPAGIVEEFLQNAAYLCRQLGELAKAMDCAAAVTPEKLTPYEEAPAEVTVRTPTILAENGLKLTVFEGSTGTVAVNGRKVVLTRLQFRLLELLARNAGSGIPYERLEAYVWPDAQVERQQVSYHKKKLEDRLREAGAPSEPLIETLATWGLRLDLDKASVRFEKAPAPVLNACMPRIDLFNSVARPVMV